MTQKVLHVLDNKLHIFPALGRINHIHTSHKKYPSFYISKFLIVFDNLDCHSCSNKIRIFKCKYSKNVTVLHFEKSSNKLLKSEPLPKSDQFFVCEKAEKDSDGIEAFVTLRLSNHGNILSVSFIN